MPRKHEDDLEVVEPSRRRRHDEQPRPGSTVAVGIRSVAWAGFALWSLGVAGLHLLMSKQADSAIQEAAAAAMASFWLIFGYAWARGIDSLTRR